MNHRPHLWRACFRFTLTLLIVLALAPAGLAQAPVGAGRLAGSCPSAYTVTTTADSGPGSLRQALAEVCAGGAISFNVTTPATITLTTGQLTIAQDVTLLGPGADRLAISGNDASRVIYVRELVSATLSGLTIRDGYDDGFGGAGLYNYRGNLTLRDCVVTDNMAAQRGGGGGVTSNGGALTAVRTQFRNNEGYMGGALYLYSPAYLTDVTIDGNRALYGGGLMSMSGNLTGERVTFSHNVASNEVENQGSAGGMHIASYNAQVRFINSTWYGNQALGRDLVAGAIKANLNGSSLTLLNCSVISNTAAGSSAQGPDPVPVGGIVVEANTGAFVLTNTLVAKNTSPNDSPDVRGAFVSGGHNLIGDGTGATGLTNGVNGDIVGDTAAPIMALVGTLGDYGGETEVVPLRAGSPAIDAGDDAQAPAIDQRGLARPQMAASDIGAVEARPLAAQATLQSWPNNPCPGYNLYYTLAIANLSDVDSFEGVTVTTTVPAGTWFFPGQAGGMDYTYDGERIVWHAEGLGGGQVARAELTLHTSTALTHGQVLTTTWELQCHTFAPVTFPVTVTVDQNACGTLPEPTPTYEPTLAPTATMTPEPPLPTPTHTATPVTPELHGVWLPLMWN